MRVVSVTRATSAAISDHMLGLDDLRVFNTDGFKLPVFGSPHTLTDIERVFPYACTPKPAWRSRAAMPLTICCSSSAIRMIALMTTPGSFSGVARDAAKQNYEQHPP